MRGRGVLEKEEIADLAEKNRGTSHGILKREREFPSHLEIFTNINSKAMHMETRALPKERKIDRNQEFRGGD